MANHYNEECVVCEKTKTQGIHLYTSFICSECERDMVSTETNDPRYIFFLKQLRKVAEARILS
ncbi:sigma factor G inhibitor Gin [Neobacillus sp. YIM B06451]|uniref:sigma factor G inhibitor Gin n=1 Tax=Neobacillus sp. YIM B06451 TaxID=3070994 RepID=UPI00292CE1C3|nr:sigma factor G inhibitor Gin [Neobacillus sp. YIM B06451]